MSAEHAPPQEDILVDSGYDMDSDLKIDTDPTDPEIEAEINKSISRLRNKVKIDPAPTVDSAIAIAIDEGHGVEPDSGNEQEGGSHARNGSYSGGESDFPESDFPESEFSIDRRSLEDRLAREAVIENDRRYANATYPIPNDEAEETRMAISHQTFLLLLSTELTFAFIPGDIHRILDVGTGPGDWAIAMAMKYPKAEVFGTDISAHPSAALPPNVTMVIDNATEDWTFEEPFDLIHLRDLHFAFKDWPHVLRQTAQHLRSAGRVELCEHGPLRLRNEAAAAAAARRDESATKRFQRQLEDAARRAGLPAWNEPLRRGTLAASGLTLIKKRRFEIELGRPSDDPEKDLLGKMALVGALEGLEAKGLRLLTQQLEWSADEARELFEEVKAELMNPAYGPVAEVEFVMARKMPVI